MKAIKLYSTLNQSDNNWESVLKAIKIQTVLGKVDWIKHL